MKTNSHFLPVAVKDFMIQRGIDLISLCFFSLGILALLALGLRGDFDAGFYHDTFFKARHLLGQYGAVYADFLWQNLGIAGYSIAFIFMSWGYLLFTKRTIHQFWLKLLLVPIFLLLAACFIAYVISILSGQSGFNYAGAYGFFFYALILDVVTSQLPTISYLKDMTFFVVGMVAIFCFFTIMALTWQEWKNLSQACAASIQQSLFIVYAVARYIGLWVLYPFQLWLAYRRKKIAAANADALSDSNSQAATAHDVGDASPYSIMPQKPKWTRKANKKAAMNESETVAKPKKRRITRTQKTDMYHYPPLSLLGLNKQSHATLSKAELQERADILENVLSEYGVDGQIVNVRYGPVVTLFELEPAPGTKTSRVVNLADDIARSMSVIAVRVAVVPGRNVIGIELPNAMRQTVYLRELLADHDFKDSNAHLAMALGKDIEGVPVVTDLAKMPHLLMAGTTGAGKSVSVNTMILSLLYRLRPEECRLILIDPKMLELSVYDDIPHLLTPVVTEPGKAVVALKWTVKEMERRYHLMSKLGVRNVHGFNQRVEKAIENDEKLTYRVKSGVDAETGQFTFEDEEIPLEKMPFIVVVVDEIADLMMVAGKEIEAAIQRLAQMARAAGIHLILATQRPSVDVITGTIKANLPCRISFQVTSKIDSRTILGEQGAEQLLGMGDMLFMMPGGRLRRVHGPFVSDEEVEQVVDYLKSQGTPQYLHEVTVDDSADVLGGEDDQDDADDNRDALYNEAVDIVINDQKASTSYLQRRLQIGYNRAARIIDQMEEDGVIGPANHVGKREVLR